MSVVINDKMSCPPPDFDAVYREFHPKLSRFFRHFSCAADPDDLAQEVFLKVNNALDGFRGESTLATWIYRIAVNVARDHARAGRGWESVELETIEETPDPACEAADRAYIRQEMHACIRGLVEALPEQYRTVLILSDFEEITNAEIADILGLSIDNVKIRLHRARARLRSAMECNCTFYRDPGNELMCDRKPRE